MDRRYLDRLCLWNDSDQYRLVALSPCGPNGRCNFYFDGPGVSMQCSVPTWQFLFRQATQWGFLAPLAEPVYGEIGKIFFFEVPEKCPFEPGFGWEKFRVRRGWEMSVRRAPLRLHPLHTDPQFPPSMHGYAAEVIDQTGELQYWSALDSCAGLTRRFPRKSTIHSVLGKIETAENGRPDGFKLIT